MYFDSAYKRVKPARAITLVLLLVFLIGAFEIQYYGHISQSRNEAANANSQLEGSTDAGIETPRDSRAVDSHDFHQTIAPWPMHLNNPAHTGYIETPAPSTDTLFWSNVTGKTYSSPSVADGLVFIGSRGVSGDHMNAFYVENGTLAWRMTTYETVSGGEGVASSPAYWNGHVYFGADRIYCLYANNGTVKWTVETGNTNYGDGTPTVTDGKVFIGASDWKVYCIDAMTGDIVWTFQTKTTGAYNLGVLAAPAVEDNLVYVGACDGYVYQINETQPGPVATANHTFYGGQYIYSSPVVANHRVYVGMGYWVAPNDKNRFFVLNASDLSLVWEFYPGTPTVFFSSAAVAYGNVYISSVHGQLYAFDALADSPIIKWNYTIGKSWSSPAIADDKLYVGSKTGYVYAYNATQSGPPSYLWRRTLGGDVDSSPAISDGVVYVGTHGGWGRIYALGTLGDFEPPTISDVTAVPNPQEVHGSVNVSAHIHDASGIKEVLLNVTYPESMQVESFEMPYDNSSGRYYSERVYDELGAHDILIFTRDKAGNWNTTSGLFTTIDTTPPSILDIEAAPDPQEVFDFVNVSATVVDNYLISEIWVDVSDPDSVPVGNFSMSYDSATDRYYFERTYSKTGIHNLVVSAKDTSDNWNSSKGQFSMQDTTGPTISDMTAVPNPQEVFFDVNISATVTDNIDIGGVWAEVIDPDLVPLGNFSMSYDSVSSRYYFEDAYSKLGSHSFTIWAHDTSANWNSDSGTFTIIDTTSPGITETTAVPDPQEVFNPVNISAVVADNVQVLQVSVEVRDPTTAVAGNFTMEYDAIGGRYFKEIIGNLIGQYTFTIWASDSSGNTASSASSFALEDWTRPAVTQVTASPDPQEVFEPVNITTRVDDNYAVAGVWVEILDPLSSLHGNFTMDFDSASGGYYFEDSYTILGTWGFTISASDASNNWDSASGSFLIQDTTAPSIEFVTAIPDPQVIDGYVNVSARVSDSYELSCVVVNITDPEGTVVYHGPMDYGSLTGRYYRNDSYHEIGNYTFVIEANDSQGNSNEKSGKFSVGFDPHDSQPPTIWEVRADPDPQEVFGEVNVSAIVTDNWGIRNVRVHVYDPSSASLGNFSMVLDVLSGRYYYDSAYSVLGHYTFIVLANDTSGNENSTIGGFTMIDTVGPEIHDVTAVPDPQETGGIVNISALLADSVCLDGTWIELFSPLNTSLGTFSMLFDPGTGRFFYASTYSELGQYRFILSANDTSGNLNSTWGIFRIVDTATPQITDAKVEPDAQEIFGTSRVSARVSDNHALEGVWVNVTDPLDEGAGNFTMTLLDEVYYYDQICDLLGFYQFRIWAVDSSGNWNSALVQLQCIDSTRPTVETVATPNPQEIHGEVNISAQVTENHQLAGVWVEMRDPYDILLGNFSMSFDPSQGKYFYLGDYSELGTYGFVVSAVDVSGNWGSETGTFEMRDTTCPVIEDAVAEPDPQEVHHSVNLTAQVKDNHQLDSVWVEVHDQNEALIGNYSMLLDPITGRFYHLGEYSDLGLHSFVVSARDSCGNWGTGIGTFEIRDSALPFADAGPNQSVLEGEFVTFDASASTDSFGISSYEWSFNDGTDDVILSGMIAHHTFLKTGDFLVQLEVKDYSDNSARDWMWVNVSKRPAPNPPENLSVSEFGLDYIVLTWDPPTANEDGSPLTDLVGYHFYRSFTQGGPYARLTGEPFAETTYTDSCLHPGFRAYYVFTAVNSYGYESVHSNEALGQTVSKGSIVGKVVDDDAEPVALALVELLGDGEVVLLSTYTNSTGGYRLEDLDSGEYTIRAIKEGYHDASVVVDVDYGDVTLPEPLVLKKIDEAGFIPIWILIIPVVVAMTAIAILLLKRRRRAKETGISEETESSPDEV